MKILVLSDSHGQQRYMEQAVFDQGPDYIIHLGDKQKDGQGLQEKFCRIPCLLMAGNCDYAPLEPPAAVRELGGVRFFITHGHAHGVKMGLMRLCYAAQEAGAQIALYGHTHLASVQEIGGLMLVNPGACGGGDPSYGIVEISDGGKVSCRIVHL